MKIISINLGLSGGDRSISSKQSAKAMALKEWLAAEQPDLLLVQEACKYRKANNGRPEIFGMPIALPGYALTSPRSEHSPGSRVGCYTRLGNPAIVMHQEDPRWQEIRLHDLAIHHVYLPYEPSHRRDYLTRLADKVKASHGPVVIIGDFNCVLNGEDCLNKESEFNESRNTRIEVLRELADVLKPEVNEDPVFTVEQKGKEFRSDLALVSRSIAGSVTAKYEHQTRPCKREQISRREMASFTDHSGIILNISPEILH